MESHTMPGNHSSMPLAWIKASGWTTRTFSFCVCVYVCVRVRACGFTSREELFLPFIAVCRGYTICFAGQNLKQFCCHYKNHRQGPVHVFSPTKRATQKVLCQSLPKITAVVWNIIASLSYLLSSRAACQHHAGARQHRTEHSEIGATFKMSEF